MSITEKLNTLKVQYPTLAKVHRDLLSLMNSTDYIDYPMPHSPLKYAVECLGRDLLAKVHHVFLSNGILATWRAQYATDGTVFETEGNRFRVLASSPVELKLALLSAADIPLFRLQWTNYADKGEDAGSSKLKIVRCDPERPDYEHVPQCMGGRVGVTAIGSGFAIADSHAIVYPQDVDNMLLLAELMKSDWLAVKDKFRTDGNMKLGQSFYDLNVLNVHELLTADDSYIGENTLAALRVLYESTYRFNLQQLSTVIEEYGDLAKRKHLTGQAVRYHDDVLCFIEKDGRRYYLGTVLENSVDYHGFIAWNDHNDKGKVVATHLQTIRYGDTVAALDAVDTGALQPTISVDFLSDSATYAENARSSDVLELAPSILKYAQQAIRDGNYECVDLNDYRSELIEKAEEYASNHTVPGI